MRKTGKKGFTLTELIVVLVIMGIIAAIAVPLFTNYWKNAEFRKNEENAKTIYLAAESKLTYYRSSGQWDSFKKQIKAQAEKDQSKSAEERRVEQAVFPSDTENATQLNDRIYTLRLDKSTYENESEEDQKKDLLLQLIDDYIYDKDMLKASVAVEIDLESGEVYSVFYGSRCKGLTYESEDKDGYLTMQKRDYDSRKKRLLGYYSTEDTVNVVSLKPTKLRITTISLQNSEKLTLNWSSNVGDSLETSYEVTIYNKEDNSKLFRMVLSPYDLRTAGWSGKSETSTTSFASVTLYDSNDQAKGQWSFPLTYQDNKYSLVLDAMMSAKTQALLESREGTTDSEALQRTLSTSICRLAAVNSSSSVADLSSPQDIYATVKATSYAGTDSSWNVTKEYQASEAVTSNDANTLYADKSSGSDIRIATFRHLSNMRYYDADETATFTLTNKNMDWKSVGTGVYDLTAEPQSQAAGNDVQKLAWKENTAKESVDFPTIAQLPKKHTLQGNGKRTLVTNLVIGENSVIDDETVAALTKANPNAAVSASEYVGLFGELKGNVSDVTLKNPKLTFGVSGSEDAGEYSALKGIGILAGRSEGMISDTAITSADSAATESTTGKTVDVDLAAVTSTQTVEDQPAAVGGVVGILAKEETKAGEKVLTELTSGGMKNVTMEGIVEAELPNLTVSDQAASSTEVAKEAADYARGIGGIVGFAKMDNKNQDVVIRSCENNAQVSGNYFTGGIVGKLDGTGSEYAQKDWKNEAAISDSSNHGLILCTYKQNVQGNSLFGRFFGGIAGYEHQALIYQSVSTSGRAAGFSYDSGKRDLLKGEYVGGIVGYGTESMLANCSTGSGGYILGADYVGGIAGGLDGEDTIKAEEDASGVSVTTNGSYVIGKNYVGGIVGYNAPNVRLSNCVNNGVVAGTGNSAAKSGSYVGGIVGYNAKDAVIYNCASYLSDYGNKIFNMIVDQWDAKSDYVGGIAGYNNGAIEFTKDSQAITVKSVSSIVVGNNYVGGIAGFNDVEGSLDVNYTLIGGQIYAYESCAGGAFGLNASTEIAEQGLTVKPTSVYGKYCVGGCIGANVVNITKDTQFAQLRADNGLGSITGTAFCGGVIGYQRTYADGQLSVDGIDYGIRQAVADAQSSATPSDHVLPEVDSESGVPTKVMASANPYTLTLTTDGNTDKLLMVDTNNIPIKAVTYAGGIVGYCEKNSAILIKNCKNAGSITLAEELLAEGSDGGVSLGDFVDSGEITTDHLSAEARALDVHFVGGIVGANLEAQTIEHCANTGTLSGFTGIGGVVGVNAGLVEECALSEHFGNAGLEYVGGIVGLNIGTVDSCSTSAGKIISGSHHLGGIVGWNLPDGTVKDSQNRSSVMAGGTDASTGIVSVGGIAGRNSGLLEVSADNDTASRTISGNNGAGVGGIVGVNEAGGQIKTSAAGSEVVAVGSGVTVTGYEKVGGIVGINHGDFGESSNSNTYLTGMARKVQASHGVVGGIAGTTDGNIFCAINRSGSVTADAGTAGGIVAENAAGQRIENCKNYGNVSSSYGYAGGIVAENAGTIEDCSVAGTAGSQAVIYSLNVTESGAICAVNTGTVSNSVPGSNVVLRGNATVFGGITGTNTGTVTNTDSKKTLTSMPEISSTKTALTVGGAVGLNNGIVSNITAQDLNFKEFSGYQYLGGIVGSNGFAGNQAGTDGSYTAQVTGCIYSGSMSEKANTSQAGNCYGGIAGINYALLENDNVQQINLSIQGVYSATSTSTTQQKEAMASHVGGIAGKNETAAVITGCTLKDDKNSVLEAEYGMLGGVTGFNKGSIEMSGSAVTPKILGQNDDAKTNIVTLAANAQDAKKGNLSADANPVTWVNTAGFKLENGTYQSSGKSISSERLKLKMTSNGNVGGITAFNGADGAVNDCVSGDWFILNRSEAIGVGTGGIIGMNESTKDLTGLVNGAFVGRQVSAQKINGGALEQGQENRFAGGIIGSQNTSTESDWLISNCVNFGTIYCYRTHYSGGIIGQWTASGGTIEDCRNYGNLQTTYMAGWTGASGGIVAQLYHAYAEDEYNIISCENHGNIYTRLGASSSGSSYGANDSAGILGNVTTYEVSSSSKAEHFTVRILDCVNGPNVEIYSSSMAAGIFGFLSSDNASMDTIKRSSCKVDIQIERCRNFAVKLISSTTSHAKFIGGIFGARYTKEGWSHTIIKDCYSADLPFAHYNNEGDPIYSNGNTGEGSAADMTQENRKNNFTFNGRGGTGYGSDIGYYNNQFALGRKDASGNVITKGRGLIGQRVLRRTGGNWYEYQYASNVHALPVVMDTSGTEQYAFVQISSTCNTIGAECYVDGNDYLVDASGNRIGQVLFWVGKNTNEGSNGQYTYPNHDNLYHQGVENSNLSDNALYTESRNSYRRLEGIKQTTNGTDQILAPKSAAAKVADGQIEVQVTPQDLPNGNAGETCDPFAYVVTVSDSSGHSAEQTLYAESGSFAIPEGMSGTLKITVRAKSMYADVKDSDAINADVSSVEILPSPQIRAELVTTTVNRQTVYRYQFSLDNEADYSGYNGWQVKVYLNAYSDQTVTLDAAHTTGILNVDLKSKANDTNNTYQIIAQAVAGGSTHYESSSLVSTPAYMPYQRAFLGLKKANSETNIAQPSVSISGNTLDNLSVNIKLDNSSASDILSVTPIYRAELIGDWKDANGNTKTDVVFAKTDIMTVSKGVATANFSNLPEYIQNATNLHVRLWYAQTGLGPVYLYHEAASESDGNVRELVNVTQDGEQWAYTYSLPLARSTDYQAYTYTTDSLFTWLPAPSLDQADGSSLEPTYSNNRLQYSFSWDSGLTGTASYQVSLTGIDAGGREVAIDTSEAYTGGKSFTIDGEDWNYRQVRLKVTRVGDSSRNQIGLSSTATYQVAQRLSQPGAPSVTNLDVNELNYKVTWAKIADETYCSGYQIYIRAYDDNGNLGTAVPIGDVEPATGAATYTRTVDLESYAGSRIVVYLVVETKDSSIYVNSAAGVTYELQVPKRLDTPNVSWSVDWSYDTSNPMPAETFLSGGLTVRLTANDADSIPPGGSAYLLKAYVYDSQEEAENATIDQPGNALALYPEGTMPVQMSVTNAQNYYHVLDQLPVKYAGKWIVFYTRISSGAGNISSHWVKSANPPYRLPYVRLSQPTVSSESKVYDVTANVQTTPNVPGTDQIWNSINTTLIWNSVDCSDLYTIDLTGQKTDATAGAQPMNAQLRVLEHTDAAGAKTAEIQQYVYRQVPDETDATKTVWKYIWETVSENPVTYPDNTAETDKVHTYDLSSYSVPITASYQAENGAAYYYTLTITAQLRVQLQADGSLHYELKLPDTEQMLAQDGVAVTHENFTLTQKAVFTADVQKNMDGSVSEAYAASEPFEISWNN